MISLYNYFGWQGGTIHQLSEVTGCTPIKLIYGDSNPIDPDQFNAGLKWKDIPLGVRKSLASSEQMKGNLSYWLGVKATSQEIEK